MGGFRIGMLLGLVGLLALSQGGDRAFAQQPVGEKTPSAPVVEQAPPAATPLASAAPSAETRGEAIIAGIQDPRLGGHTEADILWVLIAAFLVFFMQAGFAMVEAGFTRAKNAVNIMMKNLMDFAMGSIAFLAVGFMLMFGTNGADNSGFFGWESALSFLRDPGSAPPWTYAFFLFQLVFCATAATIVSGAMAERTKFAAYLAYSLVISAVIYPVFGSWAWGSLFNGGGWLENLGWGPGGDQGFKDFAGSTVVHSVGAWAGLAGTMVLGPRIGKYAKDGKPLAIAGHNIPLATLGVFILWLGWFGFNPGSTTAVGSDGYSLALIAVNTNLAAAGGCIAAMIAAWMKFGKPDTGIALNGALAGLVAITAPCDGVTPAEAVVIGAVAGVLVVMAVLMFDRLRLDDPVGAISVHGVCGVWGTLSVGLFNGQVGLFHNSEKGWAQLGAQVTGIVACFLWTFVLAYLLFKIIQATIGLRVTEQEELEGLDIHEHGLSAYPPDA